MQRDIRVRVHADLSEKHPEWTKATLHRMLNRMVAPPDDISPPPHTTGGALDVGLRGPDGADLDCTSPGEFWDTAPTYWHKLSETARTNRLLLIGAMEASRADQLCRRVVALELGRSGVGFARGQPCGVLWACGSSRCRSAAYPQAS